MDIDTNPSALFMPGAADDFFAEFGPIRRFEPDATGFSLANACCTAPGPRYAPAGVLVVRTS